MKKKLSFIEARDLLLKHVKTIGKEKIPLLESLGVCLDRILQPISMFRHLIVHH